METYNLIESIQDTERAISDQLNQILQKHGVSDRRNIPDPDDNRTTLQLTMNLSQVRGYLNRAIELQASWNQFYKRIA